MGDNEENWFYESISRYKNLSMFELEYPVHQVELNSNSSICVSCSNKQRHQLLELSLPTKLTSQASDPSEVVITNDSDLKIKCGTFTDALVTQLKTTCCDNKVIASHLNKQDVTFYKLSTDNSDEIKRDSVIKCELESPFLALSDTELMLTKNNASSKFLIDINTGQVLKKIHPEETNVGCEDLISPVYVDSQLLAFCHQSSGQMQLYDCRDFKRINTIDGFPDQNNNHWSFTSLYECSEKLACSTQSACLATVSNNGILNLYDSRCWKTPWLSENLGTTRSDAKEIQLRFKPSDKNWLSVSGFDANINVYHLMSKMELVFVHDGHKHVEGFSAETVTTSHVWVPNIDKLIISSAENGTIQSWQFEDKRKFTTVIHKTIWDNNNM